MDFISEAARVSPRFVERHAQPERVLHEDPRLLDRVCAGLSVLDELVVGEEVDHHVRPPVRKRFPYARISGSATCPSNYNYLSDDRQL